MEALRVMLARHGLERVYPMLTKLLAPSAILQSSPAAEVPIGASRLGGRPDVPAGFAWPAWKGKPLDFIAQLDLGSIPEVPVLRQLLPASGILQFYYAAEEQPWGFEPADKGSARVVYHEPGATLRRADGPGEAFPQCALELRLALTVPPPDSLVLSVLMMSEEEQQRYFEFYEEGVAGDPPGPKHRLLGWPEPVQSGDIAMEAQLAFHGIDQGGMEDVEEKEVDRIMKKAPGWLFLLQIDTDNDAGMMWGDMGRIYFCIEGLSLGKRTFENAWVVLQCS